MRLTLITSAFLFVALSALPARASIDIRLNSNPVGDTVKFVSGPYDGGTNKNGGFVGTLGNGETWNTFCVESGSYSESLAFGATYDVHSTSVDTALATQNFVTDAAKWVYKAFSAGALVGFDANGGDDTDGDQVQKVIWSLVDGGGAGDGIDDWLWDYNNLSDEGQDWYDAAKAAVGGDIVNGTWNGADLIRVLNPVDDIDADPLVHRQSVLYEIPEPATLLVWSALGCLGFAAYRRRVKRA